MTLSPHEAGFHTDSAVVTVGTFDGVHVGHQEVIGYVMERANARQVPGLVVTFDPHPREIVRGERVPLLTTIDERAAKLASLGVSQTVVIPFTTELASLSAEDFVADVLVGRLRMGEIVIGYDHGFGRGREGDADLMRELGLWHGFAVDVLPPHLVEKHTVSSSLVRHVLLDDGDVRRAQALLGAPYALSGEVVAGDKRGRRIGYPTANLRVHEAKLVPKRGVYAVEVLHAGARRTGMLNIGERPTFDGVETRVEVHLFDFQGNLYGERLTVEFIERLRDERRFDGIEALKEQLDRDAQRCITLFGLMG